MSTDSTTHEPRGKLLGASFTGLLVAQFLGAANDNVFRWLVVGIGKELVGPEHESAVLAGGLACLVLPFLIFAGPAGWLADRYSKRTVIVGCKALEIAAMLLGGAAVLVGDVYVLFGVLFIMGAQSALFGPAKYGSIPELVDVSKISKANAAIGLSTVVATVLGSVAGNYLYEHTRELKDTRGYIAGGVVVGIAIVGWLFSLFMQKLVAVAPQRPFPWNFAAQSWSDLRELASNRALLRVAGGSAFFWSLASLAQLAIDAYGTKVLNLPQSDVGNLLAVLALGMALGNVLAGLCSRGRIELGLVPLAALGLAASSSSLFVVQGWGPVWVGLALLLMGMSAGMFDVPLTSYIQHRSPVESRGRILAAANTLTFGGMLLASVLFEVVQRPLGEAGEPLLTPPGIFLLAGVMTLPVALYALFLLPQATIRFVAWLLSTTIYRVRVIDRQQLPETGGALIIANHVSWIDGVLLLLVSSRPIRMLVYADYFENRWLRPLGELMGAIPIKPGNKRSVIEAIRTARESLSNGELVCIFPEGGLTRTNQMMGFQSGFLAMVKDTGAPIVPVFLAGLWGSIFSFERGRYFWKWPKQWPYHVTIQFGAAMRDVTEPDQARRSVMQLGVAAMEARKEPRDIPPRRFLRAARRRLWELKLTDSLGQKFTGGTLLLRVFILRRLLRREVLQADEKYVGVLLPPSGGAVLVNTALAIDSRIAVNLNYTVTADVMNLCIQHAGIRHVLTSRLVMRKLNMPKLDAEIVYIEDFRDKVSKLDKAIAAAMAYATPVWALERLLGLTKLKPDDVLTIIFTSGSTGEPKGVMLTHSNVGSNVDAIDQIVQLRHDDVLLGILPLFHSLGYTATMWTVLMLDIKGAYHVSPLEAQQVATLCRENRGTIIIATPTFLRSYLRRCESEDFKTLEVVVAGAEKLPVDLSDAFEKKFGVRPVEGYGTTECSPLVSVNIPKNRAPDTNGHVVAKEGTVGRPIPGTAAKIVDPESFVELGIDQPGMLLIKGLNVMLGYLDLPEKTAKVIRDGWYVTGDIAKIDSDGFITITGRESRFSKIGGEMVPHIKIEETIQKVIGSGEEEMLAVVTAVPDARKGERLVVLHLPLQISPDEIIKRLAAEGLPNLWIPARDSFVQVEAIPVLGTGKLDLKGMKQAALDKFPQQG